MILQYHSDCALSVTELNWQLKLCATSIPAVDVVQCGGHISVVLKEKD